jgi:hypothetical protein
MTKQKWMVLAGLALFIATAFLIGAIATGPSIFYVASAVWFALVAYLGRKAARARR